MYYVSESLTGVKWMPITDHFLAFDDETKANRVACDYSTFNDRLEKIIAYNVHILW